MTGHVVSEARITAAVTALDVYWAAHYRPPTLRALTEQLGWPAYSVTKYALAQAAQRGLILAVTDGKEQPAYVPLWVAYAIREEAIYRSLRDNHA
jgi:hypothetical protein